MKKIIIPILLTLLPCHNLYAQSNEKKFSGYELGKLHVQKYDNYQCRLLRNFVQNTSSSYEMAYKGQKTLKSADDYASYDALSTIKSISEKGLPSPFSYQYLTEQASIVRGRVFNNEIKDKTIYLDGVYEKCVKALNSMGYGNNDNYDRVIDYSKGEDKIKRPQITKIEQVCDRADFPELMEKARTNIKEFANFRKLSTEKFLVRSNYLTINRMAEDMLQAGLDQGTVNLQFLWDIYNAPKKGLTTGQLPPRCEINR